MKNGFDAFVASCERRDSHAWLRVGRGRLAARMWPGIRTGQKVRVAVRPADVVLCAGHPGTTSARNVLPVHVRRVAFVREGVEAELDAGFPLVALVTRRAARDLGLRKGQGIYALVKASAVVPALETSAPVRVSLVGPGGRIDPDRIDLLRALDREGSLGKAALALGLAYRTAWLWAREMNRRWGRPLLDRMHGGRGGGGTALTPEGRAVLRKAGRIEEAASLDP